MTDFRDLLYRIQGRPYLFDRLEINGMFLSVQASDFSYSTPRETYEDPFEYETWEIALLPEGGSFLNDDYYKLERMFPDLDFSDCDQVQGYIPTETVQEVYDGLVSDNYFRYWEAEE